MRSLICNTCELRKICKIFDVIKDLQQEISIESCIYSKQQKNRVTARIDPKEILDRSAKIRNITKPAGDPKIAGITVDQ